MTAMTLETRNPSTDSEFCWDCGWEGWEGEHRCHVRIGLPYFTAEDAKWYMASIRVYSLAPMTVNANWLRDHPDGYDDDPNLNPDDLPFE